jgi:hypothetical protein
MKHLTTLSEIEVILAWNVWLLDDKWTGKDVWPVTNEVKLKVHFCLCVDKLRKTTRNISKHNLPQDRELNPEPQNN